MSRETALTNADLDYQEADVDLKIQQRIASSQKHSVMLYVGFIMATEIGLFILTFVKKIPHEESTCLNI